MSTDQSTGRTLERIDLTIGGMTCASCANRVEKRLNKLDGVTASVNFATEKARVDFPASVSADDLLAAVAGAGYTAELPPAAEPPSTDSADHRHDGHHAAVDDLGRRVVLAAVLSFPVIVMAMIPALQFTNWQWLSLVLATPVVWWAGWPFHRAAWTNLRHGAATMDTLISLGTLAAYAWSVYALFFGTAGVPGMTHPFELTIGRTDGGSTIYLEAAAGVTTFILLGRYLEERAKRRAGSAMRALLDLGAKDVAVLRNGVETRIPVDALIVGDRFVVRPGRRWPPTVSSSTAVRRSTPRSSPVSPFRSRSGRATPSSAPRSTEVAGSRYGPPASEPTPNSPRSPGSSRTRRPARPTSSAWRTASPGSSSRWSSRSRSRPSASGSVRARVGPLRSPRPCPC